MSSLLPLALAVTVLFVNAGCTRRDTNPNILNLATTNKIKGMDPAGAQDLYASTEILRVYEPLFQYHPFKRPYELQPLIAEAMPAVSKNGLVYTIKIKKGVLFHDDKSFPEGKGREVKAKDVVYSLLRLADPKVKSTGWWILEKRVKGLDDWRAAATKGAADYEAVVPGLKVVDDYTLQIELVEPYPQLLYALAMPYGSVVAKEVVDHYKDEIINHAVGTGPFYLETYKPSELLVFKKNPNYREELFPSDGAPGDQEAGLLADAGKKLPFVDGINVRVIVEDQPRWLHFLRGEIDRSGIPKDNFQKAVKALDPAKPLVAGNLALSEELKSKGIELTTDVAADFTYTAFNVQSKDYPQLKDKRVRQAISLALDDKESIQIFYNGLATSAQTPIPPGIAGYDPEYKNPYRTGDLEKARKLLAEAGFPGGKGFPVLPYDTVASATSRQMSDYAGKQLDKIGIKISVNAGTWPQLLERVQRRQTQLWGIAWGADYPDAENFLQLFYGPNAQEGGMNSSYYVNKEFDTLFAKARILPDSPARTEMYKRLARMVAEDTPVVMGVHRIVVGLSQPWLKNDKYLEFAYNSAKYLRLDLEAKKKYAK